MMKDFNNYNTHDIKRFNMNNKIFIPKGRLTEDDAALKAKREAIENLNNLKGVQALMPLFSYR